jgi:hypothetical protein
MGPISDEVDWSGEDLGLIEGDWCVELVYGLSFDLLVIVPSDLCEGWVSCQLFWSIARHDDASVNLRY